MVKASMFKRFRKERLFNFRALFLVRLQKAKDSCNRFFFSTEHPPEAATAAADIQ